MSLAVVQNVLCEAEREFSGPEGEHNTELETDQCEDLMRVLSIDVGMAGFQYSRYMHNFDIWLHNNNYVPAGASIFEDSLPEGTPLLIIAWIMSQCDFMNPDGSMKANETVLHTYTHATKLRSSLAYGFGRFHRGNTPWHFSATSQRWEGNPTMSLQVSRYMVSLRKRKFAGADKQAMSSRGAITSDTTITLAFQKGTQFDVPATLSTYLKLFRDHLLNIGIHLGPTITVCRGHSLRKGGCQWQDSQLRWPIVHVRDWGSVPDIGIHLEPTIMMCSGHSLRKGGCQWQSIQLRWPVVHVRDWGRWSNHSSIFNYLDRSPSLAFNI